MSFDDLDPERLGRRLSEKWQRYGPGLLPAWVAEMDYPLCPAVRGVLERALDYDDLGYPAGRHDRLVPDAFAERMASAFGWHVNPARVEVLSDVVQGLYLAMLALTSPGDGVLIHTPIYPPFLSVVRETGRRLIPSPLVDTGARHQLDLDHVRAVSGEVRALMLCHPHNPTGRVFERAELEALAELAIERDWVVLSDEIHADLTYPGHEFVPFAALGPEVAARTVTLSSASKAFNIAGLRCAVAHFGSPRLQQRVGAALPAHARGGVGLLGLHATAAAWREGGPWLARVKAQLDAQRRFVFEQLRARLPDARVHLPEATYLAWLDLRAYRLEPSPAEFFRREARVALSDGAFFGDGFEHHARLNFATSRALSSQIVERLAAAVSRGNSILPGRHEG